MLSTVLGGTTGEHHHQLTFIVSADPSDLLISLAGIIIQAAWNSGTRQGTRLLKHLRRRMCTIWIAVSVWLVQGVPGLERNRIWDGGGRLRYTHYSNDNAADIIWTRFARSNGMTLLGAEATGQCPEYPFSYPRVVEPQGTLS